ncbi:FixH family protein [Hahella chejuensis]|nr:FixH family protein [Hahella chejuensis]
MSAGISLPWYKEKWVWLLIGLPASSVLFSILMVTLAVQGKDTLVKDDYYKDGLAINQELAKDRIAQNYGLSAQTRIDEEGRIKLMLTSGIPIKKAERLNIQFIHPTLAEHDYKVALIAQEDGYYGIMPSPIEGRRYIQLSDADGTWRLKGESWLPTDAKITLSPAVPTENE